MTADAPLLSVDLSRATGLAFDAAPTGEWFRRLRVLCDAGEVGFLGLAGDHQAADDCAAFAAAAPEADDVVIVGMGGSALSARVVDAIRPDAGAGPRLTVFDTVDAHALAGLCARLDPARTLLLGVSKSGSTLETQSVFPRLAAWMHDALGDAAVPRIAVITGGHANPLRARADDNGYATFEVPGDVGGRYSALTPVGLLPAALAGLDPRRLVDGAAAAAAVALDEDLRTNPALALALMHADAEAAGLHTAVIWPYGERLAPLGPWCAQLISESTGQQRPDGSAAGVAAFPARGPADQHSLLQLLLDGPPGRLAVFIESATDGDDELDAVLAAARAATAHALTARERPSATIRLASPSPEAIGAFWLTYETAVALWGLGRDVNPFEQPAVELGKRAAAARLAGETLSADGSSADDGRVVSL